MDSAAKSGLSHKLSILTEVIKLRITILVSFTTTLGYILASENLASFSAYPVLGIFLLACGAAALNHYQERDRDYLMDRTKNRPLPSGEVSPMSVLLITAFFIVSGSLVLYFGSNVTTLLIGLTTFFWYNAVYTPLKKVMALAIIPGSLVGALPPLAGWTAAGGDILDPKILIVATFFFVWQIPHFWILLLVYGNDYAKGGYPTLTSVLTKHQLMNITFSWILLTIAVALSFNFFGILNFFLSGIALLVLCGWIFFESVKFRKYEGSDNKVYKGMFMRINVFVLLIITLLSLDKLLKLFLE
ncbi:MAG: protoheme IX farnesyltransferase [Ignavibacteria bacterium]|nr:protoheme IX farnesyltransferase [Ignavibacteria bacterium]